MMKFLEPSKQSFRDFCDDLTVYTWLQQIKTYLNLIGIGNTQLIRDQNAKLHLLVHC